MTRKHTKTRRKRAAYYAAEIANNRIYYIRQLLDTFTLGACAEDLHEHLDELNRKNTSFSNMIQPHAKELLRGVILSPDDLSEDLIAITYLKAIPNDILNCIKYYLFVPFMYTTICTNVGVSYCGIKTGIERIYSRYAQIKEIAPDTYVELVRVDGIIHARIEHIAGVLREKVLYSADHRIIHVHQYYLDDERKYRPSYMTRYPFLLTRHYSCGLMIQLSYAYGEPYLPEKRYMHGKLISETVRPDV